MCEESQTFTFFGNINNLTEIHRYVMKNYLNSATIIYKKGKKTTVSMKFRKNNNYVHLSHPAWIDMYSRKDRINFVYGSGPTYYECVNEYSTVPWITDTKKFFNVNEGIQLWKVPKTGIYKISANFLNFFLQTSFNF